MSRESGYYRVKLNGKYEIAKYYVEYKDWQIIGTDKSFCDSDFDEINECKIEN
jgi:hypothetical protein